MTTRIPRLQPRGTVRRVLLVAMSVAAAACSPKGEALYQRAEKSLASGDVRAAVIDLKNLVQAEPDNTRARVLLAAALAHSGNLDAAQIEIQKAKDLGAPADALLVPECRVMAARGEFEPVLAQCRPEAVAVDVKPEMHIAQGRALLGLERAAEAKLQFEAALAARPGSLDALLGAASATYVLEGLPAARAVMEKASPELQPRSAYWMAMGSISAQAGEFAAAEQDYQRALDAVGKGAEGGERLMALGALAEAQLRQGKLKEATATADQLAKVAPNNPMVKVFRAEVAAAGGDLAEARTLAEQAVAAMPENSAARTLLGIVNMQQGNLGQAEMHFQTVLATEPQNVRVQKLLAATRAQLQSPADSLQGLQPALSAEDADPSLLAMAGRMSLASGDREQALTYFTQASVRASDQPANVQLEVASGYLMAGEVDRAIEVLEKISGEGPTGLQREYLLLAALLRKGDNDKAVAEARALVERQGDDPRVRNLAAGVYAAVGQKEEARKQFAAALELKPNDPATLVNLARLDFSDRRLAEAEAGFRKVLGADAKNLLATVGMAAVGNAKGDRKEAEKWLRKASSDHPDSLEAQLALVQFYMGAQQFAKAREVVDAAAQSLPDNAALSNARGLVQMGQNDIPGALASFKLAATQAPKTHAYALNLARAHLANLDLDSTLDVLNAVLKSEPKYLPALALAAASSLRAGQVEKATGYIERLQQAAPESPGTQMLEGDLAMAQKRYRDALGHYRQASAKGTSSQLVVAEYRAAVLAGEARSEAALEEWVKKNPTDTNAVLALAEARQRQGRMDDAIALYEQSLAGAPDNVVILNNLAVLYDLKGSPKAAELAGRAYKAAPNVPHIADTYGWSLFKQGKIDEALPLLQQAASGLPSNAEVQYHLAAALARKGEKAEAVALLEKAVNGALSAEQKADAQKLLAELSQ